MEKNISIVTGSAFNFLRSLPPSKHSGERSAIIDGCTAKTFTDEFRESETPFTIPISWTMTKAALINMLGITSYEHYPEVNGIRFYASINSENQLTLIAVSTKEGTGCNDDLTIDDEYPYYDYADPCPVNCSNIGNLKAIDVAQVAAYFVRCV